MNNVLRRIGYLILTKLLQIDRETVPIFKTLILILILQRALLEMSYVCENDRNTIQYILTLFARPQLIMPTIQVGYVSAICSIGFAFAILLKLPGHVYFGLYLQILRCNAFNFMFELSYSYVGYFSNIALGLMYLGDVLIMQGTLNINTKNLQITRNNILNQIASIGNLILIIMNIQGVSKFSIIIVAIFNSVFQLVSHCVYSPYKSLKLAIIISCIYCVTLYTAIINYIGQQNNFNTELVMFPFIFRLLHTQITARNRKFRTKINQILYDFEENNKYCNQLPIQPKSIEDQIIYASIQIFQQQYYNAWTILWNLDCTNKLQQFKMNGIKQICLHQMQSNLICNLTQYTDMHEAVQMLMESENQNIIIQQKIIYILKEKIHIHQQLIDNDYNINFKRLLNFNSKLLEVRKILEQQYDNYPCNKTQNVLGFYYSEIMNELMLANKLFSIQAISDEKLKKKGIISETFSSKMFYLITRFSSKGLITLRTSNNACLMLEIQNEQLINKSLNFLIPSGVVEWHDTLIQEFMDTGNSKFMRRSNENYYQSYSNGYVQAIDFAIDVSFLKEVNFIAFIQPSTTQPFLMILNQKLEISNFTKNLIQQIEVLDSSIHNQKIFKFIPKFDPKQNYIENVEVNFSSLNQTQCYFQTSIQINRRMCDNIIAYYFIYFDYFRKISGWSQNSPEKEIVLNKQESEISLIEGNQSLQVDEYIKIDEPYEVNYDIQEENQGQNPQLQFQIEAQKISYLDVTQKEEIFLYSPKQNQLKLIQSHSQSQSQSQFQSQSQLKKPLFFAKICKEKISVQDEDNLNQPQKHRQLQLVYEDNLMDDGASQVSSLMGVRKSKYFKKYEILTKLHDLQSNSRSHKIFVSVFLLSLSIQIILGIVQIVQININLNNLVSDIDLLQIKNLVFQPLESFLVTRWTLVNYNTLRDNKEIQIARYNEIVQYPRSNLALGYDSLASNIYQVLNRKELQNFLLSTQLSMYQYIDTNKGEIFQMTLRNAINVLLNYQYIFKMAYQIDGAAVSDSPYVYFSYRNYKPLKISFSQLNESVLKNTQDRATKMLYQSGILFYLSISSLILCFIGNYVNVLLIFMKYRKYLNIVVDSEKQDFELDIQYNKGLLDLVQKDQNKLFKFQFYLDMYEMKIDQFGEFDESRRRKKNNKYYSISTLFWLIIFLSISATIAAHSIATYEQTKQYLTKYSDTCVFYKQVSDIGTDIPTMYAQREILYGRHYFTYFNSSDFLGILQEVKDGLIRTRSFTEYDQDFNQLLLSDNFKQYYQNIQDSNLCPYLPIEIKLKSLTICSQSMSGNMQRGLKPILIYIINFIQTDMEINQFLSRNTATYMELEGAFLVSEVIKEINKNFNTDLREQTNNLLFTINVLYFIQQAYNIGIQIFLFMVLVMAFTNIKQHLIRQYYLVQRLLYLTPRKTLFSDDLFERNVRTLLMSDSIN